MGNDNFFSIKDIDSDGFEGMCFFIEVFIIQFVVYWRLICIVVCLVLVYCYVFWEIVMVYFNF